MRKLPPFSLCVCVCDQLPDMHVSDAECAETDDHRSYSSYRSFCMCKRNVKTTYTIPYMHLRVWILVCDDTSHKYLHTQKGTYIHTCIYMQKSPRSTCPGVLPETATCTCIQTYVYMYVCMYVCIYIYIYIIHTGKNRKGVPASVLPANGAWWLQRRLHGDRIHKGPGLRPWSIAACRCECVDLVSISMPCFLCAGTDFWLEPGEWPWLEPGEWPWLEPGEWPWLEPGEWPWLGPISSGTVF